MDCGSQLDEEEEEDEEEENEDEEEEEEEERKAANIKSNNPHLAGGEKCISLVFVWAKLCSRGCKNYFVFICCKSCAHLVFFLQNCARSWRQERRAGGGRMCGRVDLEWRGGVAQDDFVIL